MAEYASPQRIMRGRTSALLTKNRVETLSDSLFAIVMTILVIDIKVPISLLPLSDSGLYYSLQSLGPLLSGYVVSFLVLSMFWMSHHVLFHAVSKNVNRQLITLNMFFLMFVALVPFSTHLLGIYHEYKTAVLVYGANIIVIGIVLVSMLSYALYSREIKNGKLTDRVIRRIKIRIMLPPLFAALAILISSYSIPMSLFLFAFPIMFNIIPGSLTLLERLLHNTNSS